MLALRRVVYEDRPGKHRPAHAVSTPIPSNVDKQNPNKNLLTINLTFSQYNRNSRTGNARRAVSQPDHDILEGLPIRRWHKKSTVINTSGPEKTDINAVSILRNGYPELEMPKDSNLLPEITYAILRAARMGTIIKERSDDFEEGAEPGHDQKVQTEEKPGLLTRKWTLFGRDLEPKEPEYLAKRRKGLHSFYGGSTAPINAGGQMRKIKIRNIDSEGNSQIVEALVPEGQAVDAEIVEEELTSPTRALAPGTKVDGVGVANAEGVLVPEDHAAAAAQRKRPPPPKRRLKGPGRGKKKKVAFAPGTDGFAASNDLQAAVGATTKLSDGDSDTLNGPRSIEGDNEGDSVMHDAGQDGEEGSEDASEVEEGEEVDREDGEISATPEAPLEPSKAQIVAKQEPHVEMLEDKNASALPVATTTESQIPADVLPEKKLPAAPEGPAPMRMDESYIVPSNEPPLIVIAEAPVKSELGITTASSAPVVLDAHISDTFAISTSELPLATEVTNQPSPTVSMPSASLSEGQEKGGAGISGSIDPPSGDSSEALEEQGEPRPVTQASLEPSDLPVKPPPLVQSDVVSTNQDSSSFKQLHSAEQIQEPQIQSPTLGTRPESVGLDPPEIQAQSPRLSSPMHSPPEVAAVSAVPLEPSAALPLPSEFAEPVPVPAPAGPASALHHDQQEMPQALAVDSWTAPVEHHTPKAPTPSPPTPIATSFDIHQRERLMGSPRAPTMSPPTPARGFSSSPDLPLATHEQPPPLELAPTSSSCIPGSGRLLPPGKERIDVEAAPNAPENLVAEIPHEHNPLDGLAVPSIPKEEYKETEEPARFSDGEEDLLGSLERSLGK